MEVERPKPAPLEYEEPRCWNVPLIGFCLACGVLATAGEVGYSVVVWVITAMLLLGLARVLSAFVRWSFSSGPEGREDDGGHPTLEDWTSLYV